VFAQGTAPGPAEDGPTGLGRRTTAPGGFCGSGVGRQVRRFQSQDGDGVGAGANLQEEIVSSTAKYPVWPVIGRRKGGVQSVPAHQDEVCLEEISWQMHWRVGGQVVPGRSRYEPRHGLLELV